MSLNPFRSKMKRKNKAGYVVYDKKNSDSSGGLTVSSSADILSPAHQIRKASLSVESPAPSARSTPSSPLVNKQSGLTTPSGRGDCGSNGILHTSNGNTVLLSGFVAPLLKVSNEDAPLDRKGIIDITVNVQSFLASISKLRKAMEDLSDVRRSSTHSPDSPTYSESGTPTDPSNDEDELLKYVSDLIQVVETCLGEHNGMQSSDIKDAVKDLTTTYDDCKHVNPATCSACNSAIESLIDTFTNSVSEYLTGESARTENYATTTSENNPFRTGLDRVWLSKSHDNLSAKYCSFIDLSQQLSEPILEDIDQALFGIAESINVAAQYIKTRIKYHKEIVAYLSKRAQIEQRYMQQMVNLGNKTCRTLQEMSEEHPLPLVDVFRKSVEADMRTATNSNTTFNHQVGSKLMEPLEQKVQEFDKRRKDLTNTWNKEKKKLMESKTVMKNALSKYRFLGEDLARVKNLLSLDPYGKQAEKRKKEVSDLENKWQEAELAYKSSVADCNDCQYQVQITAQKSILCAYRRMVIDFDIQLQSGLGTYFKLQSNFFMSLPEPMGNFINDVEEYNIGSEFMAYIRRHPEQMEEPEDYLFEEFDPDAEGLMEANESYIESTSSIPNSTSSDSTILNQGVDDQIERVPSPFSTSSNNHDLPPTLSTGVEGTQGGGGGNLNITSPQLTVKKIRPRSELMVSGQCDANKNLILRRNSDHTNAVWSSKDNLSPPVSLHLKQQTLPPGSSLYSKTAGTHTFKKLRGPARCRECDTYVYFHGQECEICGLACHKKCLETLAIRCGTKRLARKMNTFGVDFQKHLKATNRCIPIIVTRCIEEIDERALDTRGLYRIPCVKSHLEHLCQLFESGADRVDLTDRPSHLIGCCLKLYFRQLPEPVLTFQYYHDFITFARECSYVLPCNMETVTGEKKERALEMLERLKGLLQNLPFKNYITMAKLLHHLNKVSHPDHVKHNFMPPSNLGIVFGPNLLRQRDQVASLALLADMTAQAKAIEIMIAHVHQLFQLTEEKIKELEHDHDDNAFTHEMLVGDETESLDPDKSPVDIYDKLKAGFRTTYTPPEASRKNVYELGEVLEALALHPVGTGSTEDDFSEDKHSLPTKRSSDDSTIFSLNRHLRSSLITNTSMPLEKMLTPVEERPAAEHADDYNGLSDLEEEERSILISTSNMIDAHTSSLSRSGSTLSNRGPSFSMDSEVSSTKDNVSILSGGRVTPVTQTLTLATTRDETAVSGEETEEGCSGGGGVENGGLEERKDLSLLRDNDSTTSDLLLHQSFPTKVASAAEETPFQRIPDSTRPVHDIYTKSSRSYKHTTNATAITPPHLRSLYSRSTGDFSLSCAAILVRNSLLDPSQKKMYSVSEKYARYEQHRSSTVAMLGDEKYAKYEQHRPSTVARLGDEARRDGNKGEKGELKMPQSQGEDGELNTVDGPERERKEGSAEESVIEAKLGKGEYQRLFEVQELSSMFKQCDSGIDDTPDSSKYFRERTRRLSMPPSYDDVHIADTKLLAHTATFASRESGIADSPIPELPSDEVTIHKVQGSPPLLQQVQSSLPQQQQVQKDQQKEVGDHSGRESPKQMIIITQTNSEEELIDMETEEELESDSPPPTTFHLSNCYDRSISVPRSLDNPSFSRYARTPIRDSKLLRASESPHNGMELCYRSISMDKISSFRDKNSASEEATGFKGSKDCDGRAKSSAGGIPNSQSASFVPYQLPAKLPGMSITNAVMGCSSSVLGANPNTCLTIPATPTSPPSTPPPSTPPPSTPHSVTLPRNSFSPYTPPAPSQRSRFSSPSPIKRKAKIGKGFQKFKPALRVFKIASSGSSGLPISPIPLSKGEGTEEKMNRSDETTFAASYPGGSIGRGDRGEGLEQRARMVSPEAVAINTERIPLSSGGFMQRSRSLEDIVDVADSVGEGEKDWQDFWPTTNIGRLVVLPEPKHLPQGKGFRVKAFLGKMGKKTEGTYSSREFLLEQSDIKHGIASKQVEEVSSSSDHCRMNTKSQCLPHFV